MAARLRPSGMSALRSLMGKTGREMLRLSLLSLTRSCLAQPLSAPPGNGN